MPLLVATRLRLLIPAIFVTSACLAVLTLVELFIQLGPEWQLRSAGGLRTTWNVAAEAQGTLPCPRAGCAIGGPNARQRAIGTVNWRDSNFSG